MFWRVCRRKLYKCNIKNAISLIFFYLLIFFKVIVQRITKEVIPVKETVVDLLWWRWKDMEFIESHDFFFFFCIQNPSEISYPFCRILMISAGTRSVSFHGVRAAIGMGNMDSTLICSVCAAGWGRWSRRQTPTMTDVLPMMTRASKPDLFLKLCPHLQIKCHYFHCLFCCFGICNGYVSGMPCRLK